MSADAPRWSRERSGRRRRRTRVMFAGVAVASTVAVTAVVRIVSDDPDSIGVTTTDVTTDGTAEAGGEVGGGTSTSTEPPAPATVVAPTATPPSTTIAPPDPLTVSPFGVSSEDLDVRAAQLDIETRSDPDAPGAPALSYVLQLGFDAAGRSGIIVPATATDDAQLSVEASCADTDCRFEPNDQEMLATFDLTVRTTDRTLTSGAHDAVFTVRFDDGTTARLEVHYYAQRRPSADLVGRVGESTGDPVPVQTVFGVGRFAYHAIFAFDSIWIIGKSSGTVARIDAATGELLATISLGADASPSSSNRLAPGSEAIYAVGSPVVRIDPTDDTATRVDGGIAAYGVIADGNTAWAAGRGGIQRIDPDGSITTLLETSGLWFDLALSNDLVWAVSQGGVDSRLIAFDGETGEIRHDVPLDLADREFPVRVVADERSVVVGTDTSGGGGRTGRLIVVDPATGTTIDRVDLSSRPEGIVLTDQHIWTSEAVLDRFPLRVRLDERAFGFSIARGPDGSIWGTSVVPGSSFNEGIAVRWAPGDHRD